MTTLHIDITIKDLDAFRAGFGGHAEARRSGGVLAERVSQVADEPGRLQIELDFAGRAAAEAFLGFLRQQVWASNADVIDGVPQPTLLEPLALQPA